MTGSVTDLLTRRRRELGLSQPQAARELDVSRTLYRLWELGEALPSPIADAGSRAGSASP
jgi:DNA-binding transcriptional regulator YiaG